ncbi:hypothetical protein LguiB_023343 [Lonicera macranthoides]
MSATVVSEAVLMAAAIESQPVTTKLAGQMEVEFAKCGCCGLTEECTPAYIERIRERYQGKWICGLCGEAVKDEMVRCKRLVSTEEALTRHINFCNTFRSPVPPSDPTVHLISAMKHILRRSLDAPRSMPGSPMKNNGGIGRVDLTIAESCILSLVDSSKFDCEERGSEIDYKQEQW